MMSDVQVSVIIPCFNAADFVVDAVRSALAQEVPGVEILVINDGSPDKEDLEAALGPYLDRIRYLDEPHRGLAGTRNRGIEAAEGKWLSFLDADDVWKPGFLRGQLDALAASEGDLVYCDAEHFSDATSGPELAEGAETVMSAFPSVGPATAPALLLGDCLVVMSTAVVRTDTVRSVGGFDAELKMAEDLDLWLKIATSGARITYHREPWVRRRVHGTNMSAREAAMLRWVMKVTSRHAETIPLSSRERRRLRRRVRGWWSRLHLLQAKAALAEERFGVARNELWRSVRASPTLKTLVAAVGFTLAPGLAHRWSRGRYEPAS